MQYFIVNIGSVGLSFLFTLYFSYKHFVDVAVVVLVERNVVCVVDDVLYILNRI